MTEKFEKIALFEKTALDVVRDVNRHLANQLKKRNKYQPAILKKVFPLSCTLQLCVDKRTKNLAQVISFSSHRKTKTSHIVMLPAVQAQQFVMSHKVRKSLLKTLLLLKQVKIS